jgi:hypothetical protein
MPRATWILALPIALACGREVVFVDPPPAASSDTTGTDSTVVKRVDLAITVTIRPGDSALAERLGLGQGRLAGAQVTARRVEGQQEPQSGTTDSLGRVTLPGLIEGVWATAAWRVLTDVERGLLDSTNRDVTAFGGVGRFTVVAPAPTVTIQALAGRQGTLVISEAYLPLIADVIRYQFGQYIEVHNNGFDTLYLDGKIIGMSLPWVSGTVGAGGRPCSEWARWLEDPEGIWTANIWAFPGSGTTYPLGPGQSAIVATDAVDHRVVRPDLVDLSRADFEFLGTDADVDNPAVPNMREFPGWSDFADAAVGHGPYWQTQVTVFLAERLEPDSLVRDNLPVANPAHLRIPRSKILDVLTSGLTPDRDPSLPYCPNFVHPDFDGQYARLVDGSTQHSLTRRALVPERGILLRTMVSATDFYHATPTPGRAP